MCGIAVDLAKAVANRMFTLEMENIDRKANIIKISVTATAEMLEELAVVIVEDV